MSTLKARLLRADDDRGFGLPELLVAMFLLGIISALIITLVANFSRTFTRERAAVDSTNVAAIGMNELTRVIRSGTEIRISGSPTNRPVFLEAGGETMTLHAFLDTDSLDPRPVKVRFRVDANRQLVEDRWDADAASAPFWTFGAPSRDPDSTRPVARMIPPAGAGDPAIFTYRSAVVCPPADPGCNILTPGAGGMLTEAQRRLVAIVEITLTVQADLTERAAPVTLRNQVGLPNLGIDRVGAIG